MTVTLTTLDAGLLYAELGLPVVAEHAPDSSTSTGCDCPKPDCTKPGKHPRTANGSHDATTDEPTIRRWFERQWPHANIGTDAEKAGLLIIAPDCPERLADFQQRGLPPTATSQSGGGEGHLHYYYRRPAHCPTVNVNKPDDYDLMAAGNDILPPSVHASGRRYEWITPLPADLSQLPAAPDWAVAELVSVAAKRAAKGEVATSCDPNEPPVLLSDYDLRLWRGEVTKRKKKDGTLERSGSLVKIGRALYDAGATRRTIVTALAERDEALGWHKYSRRPDAAAQYHAIVNELERNGRNQKPIELEPGATNSTCSGAIEPKGSDGEELVCVPRAEYDRLRTDNAELRAILVQQVRILKSENLAPAERIGLVGALNEVWSNDSRAPGELQPIYRPVLQREWNIGKDKAGKAIELLGKVGVIEKQTKAEQVKIDRETGEVYERPMARNVTRARPIVSRPDAWAIVARAASTKEEREQQREEREQQKARRGPCCPLHPDAGTRVTTVCLECQTAIDQAPTFEPTADVGFEPDPALWAKKSPIGGLGAGAHNGGSTYQAKKSSIGDTRAVPRLLTETLTRAGMLSFPPVMVNGSVLQGRAGWLRLRDPSMFPWIPQAAEQIEQLERDRAGRML